MKTVYTGLESGGKSYMLSKIAYDCLHRNAKWLKQYGWSRPIVSNMRFSDEFVALAEEKGVIIRYWSNLDELLELEGCDLFIDEIGTYFDARGWESLSLDFRRWLAQGDKSGVDIYATAQDFAQVDKSFRRLVKRLYTIRKLVGSRRPALHKPPTSGIWGLLMMRELDPFSYDEEEPKTIGLFPSFVSISQKYTSIFNTNQKIAESATLPLKHVQRICNTCGKTEIRHA